MFITRWHFSEHQKNTIDTEALKVENVTKHKTLRIIWSWMWCYSHQLTRNIKWRNITSVHTVWMTEDSSGYKYNTLMTDRVMSGHWYYFVIYLIYKHLNKKTQLSLYSVIWDLRRNGRQDQSVLHVFHLVHVCFWIYEKQKYF